MPMQTQPTAAAAETPTPRAQVLSYLEARRGTRVPASELGRILRPPVDEPASLIALLRKMDEDDLINVDFEVDAEGVEHAADPACWVD